MKKTAYVLLLIFPLLIACFSPEANNQDATQLIIENAFYHNTITGNCIIQFDYICTTDTCKIGGYGIDWQDGSRSMVDYYIMAEVLPGVRYTIQDEHRSTAIFAPIIQMYGYPLHENDSFDLLSAEKTSIQN